MMVSRSPMPSYFLKYMIIKDILKLDPLNGTCVVDSWPDQTDSQLGAYMLYAYSICDLLTEKLQPCDAQTRASGPSSPRTWP